MANLIDGYLVKNAILSQEGGRQMAQGEIMPGVVHPLSFKALVLEEWCRMMSAVTGTSESKEYSL